MRIAQEQPETAPNAQPAIGMFREVLQNGSRASNPTLACGPYRLRFAESREDLEAAFRLRFQVFNLELNEGLESAYASGHDTDEFDEICDHLLVEYGPGRQVVGTYRLQTGQVAKGNYGYYSAREFDFSPYERIRNSMVELGRASIHRDHRSFEVLTLLWRGIARYAIEKKARFLIGCSSLTSQCLQEGSDMYASLRGSLVEPAMRTNPLPGFGFSMEPSSLRIARMKPPRLLRAYLSIGARICGKPAIDREFKTIDFLTLLDFERLAPAARARFLQFN